MVVDKIFHTCPPPSLFPSLSPSLLPPSHPKEKIIRKKREPTLYSLEFFFSLSWTVFFVGLKRNGVELYPWDFYLCFFFQLQCSVHGPRDRLWAVRPVDMQTASSHFQDEPFPWGKKKILNWCRWQAGSALYTRRGAGVLVEGSLV